MTTTPNQTEESPAVTNVTNELLDTWATDPKGPVALHVKQIVVKAHAWHHRRRENAQHGGDSKNRPGPF